MTALQWFLLCVLFTLYLLFGGSVFMYFEQHREIEKKEEISVLRKDIKEILLLLDRDFYHNETTKEMIHALTSAKLGVIHRISSVCEAGDLLPADEIESDGSLSTTTTPPPDPGHHDDKLKWNFYNSVFFAFTVITTIGYGHLAPSTKWSKCFVMVYALFGIPINSILLSGLGEYFSSRLVKVHRKSKDKPDKKFTLLLEILFYLIPGLVVFMIVPAIIFAFIESWSFLDSFYFAFVSLTTIGFGDYVAGMGNGHTVWMWIYKSFIVIWITFGLGYLIMILGFISKGMTHKRVRVVIEKRLNTIRFTKEKLSRDIDYMRRVVNELYLMKIKPVYDDDSESEEEAFKAKAKRTQSQPNISRPLERRHSSLPQLTEIRVASSSALENGGVKFTIGEQPKTTPKLVRRCSDSDLSHIDRDKTFTSAIRQQVTVDELLVTVVNALSGNVMHEVMDAVEELNEYEQEVLMEEDTGVRNHHHDQPNYSTPPPPQETSHTNHYDRTEMFDDLPPWDLGALSESDEEVLIEEGDETDNLQQVVVHGEGTKASSNTTIMEKVSGAIRKISSGSRTSTDGGGPSRKISRSESSRRKLSRTDSFERKHTHSHIRPYLNPLAHGHHARERKSSQQRKISEESRISNISSKSRLTDALPPGLHGYGSNASSRKISAHDDDNRSKISLESTSLADFLQALDNVHSRLASKSSVASFGGESSMYSDAGDDSLFNSAHPIVRRSARRRRSEAAGGIMDHPNSRRRKNGITHPGFAFAYVNNSFVFDGSMGSKDDDNNESR